MGSLTLIQKIAVWALPVLFAITIHEVAHGWVASKLGDKTAMIMGRVTLNPFKHIDIFGTIIVPIILLMLGGFVFGWAKPVPVTFANLKHPRRDTALVAAAGPVSNLLMACLWAGIAKLAIVLLHHNIGWALGLLYMGQAGLLINLIFMVLNLLPIPPLDGSRIVSSFLPPKVAFKYNRIAPYGIFILLGLLFIGLYQFVMAPVIILFFKLISKVFFL